jgi:Uma2 family endonuclease
MLREVGDDRVRMTYDGRTLEFRVPSRTHERAAETLHLLIRCLVRESRMEMCSGGSSTLRSETVRKGLEPDRCVWFRPPPVPDSAVPDLAVEVDITSSSLDRLSIYAALSVPEVWRFDGERLEFLVLQAGEYRLAPAARSFPAITPADLLEHLRRAATLGEIALEDEFRAFVRRRLAGQP